MHPLCIPQAFWLGGTSILDAIIWIPFILSALKKVNPTAIHEVS
jgi:hypothetical protein